MWALVGNVKSNMVIQQLVINLLLMSTLQWMEVLGRATGEPELVTGDIVTIEELGGYIVAMRYNGQHACGGSLIHQRIVLTSAHCFGLGKDKEKWDIRGGISTLEETGLVRHVKNFIMPKAFNESTLDMDVAVVLLDGPLLAKNIKRLSLCNTRFYVGMNMTVSGFGMVLPSGTEPEIYLRKAIVPIISKIQCRKLYKNTANITRSMLCAGELGKRVSCTYDSGGPLVYRNQLCGIVSFGTGCSQTTYPGVYARITYAKPFIIRSMKKLLPKQKINLE